MRLPWVKLPSAWIRQGGLVPFKWQHGGTGADQIAALMALIVLAQHADQDTGRVRVTYNDFCDCTGLSRAKVARGLTVLEDRRLIERPADAGQSVFQVANYDAKRDWAKFPARSMYAGARIRAFTEFRLRKAIELDALKLLFLMAERRDNRTNLANISYPKIEEYAGIPNIRIRSAVSLLASHALLHVEHIPRMIGQHGVSNAYRIAGIDTFRHMGTIGRTLDASDFE